MWVPQWFGKSFFQLLSLKRGFSAGRKLSFFFYECGRPSLGGQDSGANPRKIRHVSGMGKKRASFPGFFAKAHMFFVEPLGTQTKVQALGRPGCSSRVLSSKRVAWGLLEKKLILILAKFPAPRTTNFHFRSGPLCFSPQFKLGGF